MITFKQFISEEEKADLVEYLKANCAQACAAYARTNSALWRGMSMSTTKYYVYDGKSYEGAIVTPRKDREPLNTPGWAHKIANEYFKKEFGAPLRSTAVFCSGYRTMVSQYGENCAIFPIGKFEIVWSPVVPDLTLELFPDYEESPGSGMVAGGDDAWPRKVPTADEQEEWVRNFMQNAGYKSDIDEGLTVKPFHEKMLVCDKYLAVSMHDEVKLRAIIKATQ